MSSSTNIEVFYNRVRIHSAADYFAPAEYEASVVRTVRAIALREGRI